MQLSFPNLADEPSEQRVLETEKEALSVPVVGAMNFLIPYEVNEDAANLFKNLIGFEVQTLENNARLCADCK